MRGTLLFRLAAEACVPRGWLEPRHTVPRHRFTVFSRL